MTFTLVKPKLLVWGFHMTFKAQTLKLHGLYIFIYPQLKAKFLEGNFLIHFSTSDLLLHLTET